MRPTDLLSATYPYISESVAYLFLNHNWDDGFRETWSWKTDILKAVDLTEQRLKLRNPRRIWDMKITAAKDARRRLETILNMRTARYVMMPIWRDATRISAGLTAGASEVACKTDYSEYAEDAFVAVWDAWNHYEIRKADTVGSDTITLDYQLVDAYAPGAWVAPCLFGFARPDKKISRFTEDVADYKFVVDIFFSQAVGDMIDPETYNSLTICPFAPSWTDPDEDIANSWKRLDRETGIIEYDVTAVEPERTRSANFIVTGRANIDTFLRFIHAMAGRLTPFWLSANDRGLELAEAASSGAGTVTIKNIGYADDLDGSESRSFLYFKKTDGTVFYREVTDAAEVDEDTETLTLDSVLTTDISTATLNRFTWFEKVRFDADDIILNWVEHDCLETSIPVAVLT